jgi:hypothetical protein
MIICCITFKRQHTDAYYVLVNRRSQALRLSFSMKCKHVFSFISNLHTNRLLHIVFLKRKQLLQSLLAPSGKLRQATVSFFVPVCPYVRIGQLGVHWSVIVKFCIEGRVWSLLKYVEKTHVWLKWDKVACIIRENLRTRMTT